LALVYNSHKEVKRVITSRYEYQCIIFVPMFVYCKDYQVTKLLNLSRSRVS